MTMTMRSSIRNRVIQFLRWSEQYTKTDMVYLASGNFWLISGRVFAVTSGLVLTYALGNLLTPEQFGTYKYVLAMAAFFGALTLGGMGGAITRALAMGKRDIMPGALRAGFLWSLPTSACALVVSLYYLWMGNMVLGVAMFLVAATTPLFTTTGYFKSVLLGMQDFRGLALLGIGRSLFPVLALIAVLLTTTNVLAVIVTYFLANLAADYVAASLALRRHHLSRTGDPRAADEVVAYAKHLSIMGVISQASGTLDQLLLWHFATPAALASYSFALAPVRELRNFSDNIYPLVFPKYATKTVEEMKRSAPLRMLQIFTVSAILALLYIAAAPTLFHYLLPQYTEAVFASQLLALGLLLQPRGIVETMLYAQGNVRIRYVSILAILAVRLVAWGTLIPLWGFMGAVAGLLITDVASALIAWWVYRKLS